MIGHAVGPFCIKLGAFFENYLTLFIGCEQHLLASVSQARTSPFLICPTLKSNTVILNTASAFFWFLSISLHISCYLLLSNTSLPLNSWGLYYCYISLFKKIKKFETGCHFGVASFYEPSLSPELLSSSIVLLFAVGCLQGFGNYRSLGLFLSIRNSLSKSPAQRSLFKNALVLQRVTHGPAA